jgi:hypothetical protein
MRVTQPVVDMVFRKLGGREVLGQNVTSDLARLVHGRIPLRALIYVRRGFSDQEIGRIIIHAEASQGQETTTYCSRIRSDRAADADSGID